MPEHTELKIQALQQRHEGPQLARVERKSGKHVLNGFRVGFIIIPGQGEQFLATGVPEKEKMLLRKIKNQVVVAVGPDAVEKKASCASAARFLCYTYF